MKLLLLLAVALVPLSALAIDPLEGAFGLRLGDVFTPAEAAPQGSVRTDEHARTNAYRFQPAAPNRLFSEYWVYVTPATRRIYRIVGVARANSTELAIEQQEAVLTFARAKYVGDFTLQEHSVIQGTRSVSSRKPTVLPDGTVVWQIAYTDLALSGSILPANNGNLEEVDPAGL